MACYSQSIQADNDIVAREGAEQKLIEIFEEKAMEVFVKVKFSSNFHLGL